MCQQELRILVAVWSHYAEVQVLASTLCCNDPWLKACPGDVRQNLVVIVFCLFKRGSCWKMLLCRICVQAQQCSFFCLLFHHLSFCLFVCCCAWWFVVFFFFFLPLYFISSIKSYVPCECAGAIVHGELQHKGFRRQSCFLSPAQATQPDDSETQHLRVLKGVMLCLTAA